MLKGVNCNVSSGTGKTCLFIRLNYSYFCNVFRENPLPQSAEHCAQGRRLQAGVRHFGKCMHE